MTTDVSEKGLEALIVADMTGLHPASPGGPGMAEDPQPFVGLHNWILGNPQDYDRAYTVDLAQLRAFLAATQKHLVQAFDLDNDSPTRQKLLARLQGEIGKRGVIDVLRHGIKHGPHDVALFFGTPTPGNVKAAERFAQNRFSVTRQLRYSRDETANALDLALFINGLPIATFELKNSLTKQTVEDAIEQYKRDRDPREKLFEFGRCVAHFAVDDAEVRFCTHLKGKASWFLPFNQGWNDGTGNPPNPQGLKTDYLWKRVLTPMGLTDILENYAQIVERKDFKTGKVKREQIPPPPPDRPNDVSAAIAQSAERVLGKDEASGSIPDGSAILRRRGFSRAAPKCKTPLLPEWDEHARHGVEFELGATLQDHRWRMHGILAWQAPLRPVGIRRHVVMLGEMLHEIPDLPTVLEADYVVHPDAVLDRHPLGRDGSRDRQLDLPWFRGLLEGAHLHGRITEFLGRRGGSRNGLGSFGSFLDWLLDHRSRRRVPANFIRREWYDHAVRYGLRHLGGGHLA